MDYYEIIFQDISAIIFFEAYADQAHNQTLWY